jgi:hypothetical protein
MRITEALVGLFCISGIRLWADCGPSRSASLEVMPFEVLREALRTPLDNVSRCFVSAKPKPEILYFQALGGFVYVISHDRDAAKTTTTPHLGRRNIMIARLDTRCRGRIQI